MHALVFINHSVETQKNAYSAHILLAALTHLFCPKFCRQNWPDPTKYGTDDFPSAKATLFGEEFQANLTKSVEKDSALSKALSISRKGKKEHTTPSSLPSTSHSRGQKNDHFFQGQAGQELYPIQYTASPIKGRRTQPMEATTVPKARPEV